MTEPVLFVVPARAGSRRVPGKNLRRVGGIPLVGRGVRVAQDAAALVPGGPHRVVCSTDGAEIAAAALEWGADEVLERPADLASDTATSVDVVLHALDLLEARGERFRAVVLVQPTSPLTDPADLRDALALLDGGADSVVSVTATHPATWHRSRDDRSGVLRQVVHGEGELATMLLTGAFYAIPPDRLRERNAFVADGRTVGQVVSPERSVDVDEELDLVVAESFLRRDAGRAPAPHADRARPRTRRPIAVLTTGRQDWGILRSVCTAIRSHPELDLDLIVGGMHLSPRHGRSVDHVRADGFEPAVELRWLPDDTTSPDPPAVEQAAAATSAVGRYLAATRPDALVLLGDRFETVAAALAATLELVPIVHLHGGEQTLGAFDDAFRHAITKLAHLHLVSNEEHARRILALGEDPATVHVVGAPGLDNALRTDLPDRAELEAFLGIPLSPPVVLVTVHPATLDPDPAAAARAVVAAMDRVPATYVVTLPNVDPGAEEVGALLRAAARHPHRVAVAALGERRYWGVLTIADAMVGNSSSGLVEAPAARLPVVNVGDRQAGRHRDGQVVDVAAEPDAVTDALRRVLDPRYRETLPRSGAATGRAGADAVAIIAAWHPSRPPRKAPIRVTH